MSEQINNSLNNQGRSGHELQNGSISGLFRDIRESIVGTQQDFTTGSIGRAILLLSIPMVIEMAMESIFAVVDIFFVSRLGADAVATVGITESMITIVYALGIGFAMATTAVVARRIGEKNREAAAVSAIQAITVGLIVSIPISVLAIFHSKDLLRLMGASGEIVESGYMYTAIMLGGNGIIILLFIINAVFRGAGDPATAMRGLVYANIINIILDPCLIFGLGPFPELGVTGAAVATTTGRGIGLFYQSYQLHNQRGHIRILKKHLRLNLGVMKKILVISIGGIAQFIIATSSWIGMVRIMAEFGSEALAAYTIAIRIIIFSILPSWGMSNAAATMVGQNLGAKKPDRAERSVWVTAYINVVFLGVLAVILFVLSEQLMLIFSSDPQIVSIGSSCLRYISFGYLLFGFGMVMSNAFNGAGDTTTPTIMNFISFWLLQIPLAYFLALNFGFDEKGVFIAIVTADWILGIMAIVLFRLGRWKERKV